MNKKIKILIISFFILICAFIVYKIFNNGNNKIIKTSQELVEYILNIESYEAEIDVEVVSNKNTNKYKLKQEYCRDYSRQVAIEPTSIEGIEILYENSNLIINNTRFDLVTIYENYPYIAENVLWLNSFLEEYKNCQNREVKENEKDIEIKIDCKDNYYKYKILKIDKQSLKPTSLEIKDNNKKRKIYIQYNEIEINKAKNNTSLAFKIE